MLQFITIYEVTVTVFWGVTPCSLEDRYQRFGEPTFSILGVDPKLSLIIKIINFKESEKKPLVR
jgi:hypothetical protein